MRALLPLLLLCGGALAGPAASGLAAVPIHAPAPRTPIETAGTGLSPAVGVRVHVDASGAVERVEVLSIRPPSEYDDLIRASAVETLTGWRYAPRIENGVAVPCVLEWTVDFPAVEHAEEAPEDEPLRLDALLWVDREQAYADELIRIYYLPLAQRRKYLDELVRKAELAILRDRRQTTSNELFTVVTDHPGEGVAAIVAQNLAAAYGFTFRLFEGQIDIAPSDLPVYVYLYSSEQQYRRFVSSVRGLEESDGITAPPGLIAFHAEQPTDEMLRSTMIHKAVHAFMFRYLLRPGIRFPTWLSEGFAEYLANSEIRDGQLVPGSYRRNQVYRNRYVHWRGRSIAQLSAMEARQRIRKGEALTVEELLTAGPDRFYGESISLYYIQSWLLVHFLRHGQEGWAGTEFPRFMLYAIEGYDARDVVREVYGLEGDALEDAYRQYVKDF